MKSTPTLFASKQVGKRMAVYTTMLEHMSDEQKISVTAKLAQEVLSAAVEGGLPIATYSAVSFGSDGKKYTNNNNTDTNGSTVSGREKGGNGMDSRDLLTRKKASAVVKDALAVMASSGIRVGGPRGGAAAGDMDDGSGGLARAVFGDIGEQPKKGATNRSANCGSPRLSQPVAIKENQ